MSSDFGTPLFPELRRCVRCGMPETADGIGFDEMDVCRACQSQEHKMRIDWQARGQELRRLLAFYKEKAGDNYDCIVPISGGKDSLFQMHMMVREFGMKPLAVTFSHNWFTEAGWHNLKTCIEKLNVDHVMFTPNRGLVNKLAKASLPTIGDACWHCHRGVDSFPLKMAVAYNVPLIVWGESACEGYSGKHTYKDPPKFDYDYIDKMSTRAGFEKMVDTGFVTYRDLNPFVKPPRDVLEKLGVVRIFLSDFLWWDAERSVEFIVKEYGWREDDVGGTYKKYKSVECKMPSVHDYAKFVKRGYGRAMDHGAVDARAGLLTVEEAYELAKKIDVKRPEALEMYLEITGYSEQEFFDILKRLRSGKAADLPDPRDLPGYRTNIAK